MLSYSAAAFCIVTMFLFNRIGTVYLGRDKFTGRRVDELHPMQEKTEHNKLTSNQTYITEPMTKTKENL